MSEQVGGQPRSLVKICWLNWKGPSSAMTRGSGLCPVSWDPRLAWALLPISQCALTSSVRTVSLDRHWGTRHASWAYLHSKPRFGLLLGSPPQNQRPALPWCIHPSLQGALPGPRLWDLSYSWGKFGWNQCGHFEEKLWKPLKNRKRVRKVTGSF